MEIALSILGLIAFLTGVLYFDYAFQLASYQVITYKKRAFLSQKLVQNSLIFVIIPIIIVFWTNFRLILELILVIIYTVRTILYLRLLFKKKKVKLVFTNRFARILFFQLLIFSAVFTITYNYCIKLLFCFYLTAYYFVPLTGAALYPVEKCLCFKYIKSAKQKINAVKPFIIGITGSYGKTSIKNHITYLLSGMGVYCSPLSYNTPLGIAKTINSMPYNTKILVLEYGARKKGDIKKLLSLFPCDLGVLTGINNQHVEFFGSQENIIKEKCRLISYLNEKKYPLFLNADTKYLLDILNYVDTPAIVSASGDFNAVLSNKNVKKIYFSDKNISHERLPFPIRIQTFINDDGVARSTETFSAFINLLGDYNYSAVALAVAVAKYMGAPSDLIRERLFDLPAVKHRLEVLSGGGKILIDDAYNSNQNGFEEALYSLKYFCGKKMLVTSGVVELGKQSYKVNYDLCLHALKAVDVIIVIGKENKKAFYNAGKDSGSLSKIYFYNSLSSAQASFSRYNANVILFENDLPDNYR